MLFCLSAVTYAPAAAGCSNRTVTWLLVDRRHLSLIFEEHSQHGHQISRFLKKTYLCARASVCAMPLQNLSHASIRPSYVLTFMLGGAPRGLSDSHNTTACAACDWLGPYCRTCRTPVTRSLCLLHTSSSHVAAYSSRDISLAKPMHACCEPRF